jgi:glutamine amidotransferase
MTTIIDYGMGNLGSVKNMLKKIGEVSLVSSKKEDIQSATKILLPGVGSFDNAMQNLKELDLTALIQEKVLSEKTPIMGICLGMQLLTKGSQEGELEGFGFIDAYAKKFDFQNIEENLPIPHMGWNRVDVQKESKLYKDNNHKNRRFYFIHSYAVACKNTEDILTTTKYGYDFVSGFEKDNIIGCQFHPEKSHRYGMALLKNFVEYY